MAALALGAIGAGVGSYFGYASLGWTIGSALGNYLFAPDQPDVQGPRMQDRTVSGSAYGNTIPLVFGTYRVAGEVIDSKAKYDEVAKTEEAGKGGGGGSYTTYTYFATFALALCEGPIDGVRKIWFDGKLVYNDSSSASLSEVQKSGRMKVRGLRFYNGDETQLPDPALEAIHGAGSVPAYRGIAYIMFERLDITKYGRIPQITVEVVQDGTYTVVENVPNAVSTTGNYNFVLENGVLRVAPRTAISEGPPSFTRQLVYKLSDLSAPAKSIGAVLSGVTFPGQRNMLTASPHFMVAVSLESYDGSDNRLGIHYYNFGQWVFAGYVQYIPTSLDNLIADGSSPVHLFAWVDDSNFVFYKSNSGDLYRFEVTYSPFAGRIVSMLWQVKVASDRSDVNVGASDCITLDRLSGDIYVHCTESGTAKYKRYDADGNLIGTKTVDTSVYFNTSNGTIGFSNGRLWQVIAHQLKVADWETDTLLYSATIASSGSGWGVHPPFMQVDGNIGIIEFGGQFYSMQIQLADSAVGLDEVVNVICNRVGLEDADIDVTDLASDAVRGYMISQQTPARGALEQLSAAYFFDGRESDGVFEFVKRGDQDSVTLDDDDLGCYEGDDVQELADAVRIQEEELPKALTLVYSDVARDYQQGAQYALRQSVLNGTEATITLPIAMTSDEAKEIVDTLMYSAWENRHKFTLKTWQAFHKIEPADVISARGETLRVISRNEGVNGIIELEAVRELPQIYTGQIGTGVDSETPGQTVDVPGPTYGVLIDAPPLRDQDASNYVFYWVADGVLQDWSGATLLKKTDQSYAAVSTSDDDAVTGYSENAMASFAGPNVFDESTIIRVTVSGALESKTRDEVLNGANLAKLGDELFQFKNADLVSTGVYDLSGLLRGRLGTEWARSTHSTSEVFVLLRESDLRTVNTAPTELNVSRIYGTVSHGDTIEEVLDQPFTYTGNNLKPWAPVLVGGGKVSAAGDFTIFWMRRSRYQWQWADNINAGSDEASYDFEVRILNGVNVVRTLTVTGGAEDSRGRFSTTYTAANQTTDFGSTQTSISVQVRQVGAVRNSEWTTAATLVSGF